MRSRFAFAACLWLVLSACVKTERHPALPLNTTIGPAGGAFVVGNGEISLTVPAGALAADVTITLAVGEAGELAGWTAVGIPYRLAPTSTTFAVPCQFVLPYDPTLVSALVSTDEFRIGFRDASGRVAGLLPTFVDTATVSFDASALGTFWVAAPDVVAAAELFPLRNADVYHFDPGLALTVERTSTEPNLPLAIAKVAFTADGATSGIYFDIRQGQLGKLGEFDDAGQEIFDLPVALIGTRDALGTVRPVLGTFTGHEPFGSTQPSYQGIAETTTAIAEHVRLQTPLGFFNTVRVPITNAFSNTRNESGTELLEFWFANNVGPVAIRLGAGAPMRLLVDATVNGRPVHGQ